MRRKGVEFSLMVSIVIIITIILSILYLFYKVVEKEKLMDYFIKDRVWGEANIGRPCGGESIEFCRDFLDSITGIFVHGELERECSAWYNNCVADIKNAPPSPWAKISNSPSDLNAINYLDISCKTHGIERLKENWAKKNYYFAEKSEEEQYTIIKNACGATLVDRIYK
jgi:hypothetical protein